VALGRNRLGAAGGEPPALARARDRDGTTAAQTPDPARASPRGAEGLPINVKVDVTITDQSGTAQPFKKTISVTVADRQSGMIRSSIQVAVPSTTFTPLAVGAADKGQGGGAAITPLASYSYHSVNLNLDVREVAIEDNFVRLRLGIEYSPVDDRADQDVKAGVAGVPSFANFQQTLSLVLENGKPLQVAASSDPVPGRDRRQTVEVRATILR
jgi:hypothetical protein